MARVLAMLLALAVASASAKTLRRSRPVTSFTAIMSMGTTASKAAVMSRIAAYKAKNPLFSEEECSKMFDTKKRLGGSVPPAEFVTGCDDVCGMIRAIKEYWHSGDTASFACEHATSYGCVYDGTPPTTAADIGC